MFDQISLIIHSMADNINVLDGIIKESAVTFIPPLSRIKLLELPPHRACKLKHQLRYLSLISCPEKKDCVLSTDRNATTALQTDKIGDDKGKR